MLAAQDKGLVSGAMIGFDPAGVAKEVGLGANELPGGTASASTLLEP